MKKFRFVALSVLLLASLSCATKKTQTVATNPEVDDVSAPTPMGEGWKVDLYGVRTDEFWESQLNQWVNKDSSRKAEMSLEKKGVTKLYSGVPLKDIVAIVDDPSGGMPYIFQEDLWKEGYDITVTASDGYSATFNTKDLSANEAIFVTSVDGKALSTPQIAGNMSSKAWVRDLASIELSLAPVDLAQNNFEFLLDINGKESSYTIADLEAMEIYTEGKGSFTNSYGNTTKSIYGGVKLLPLLGESADVIKGSAIKVIAMDGYEMTYGEDMLLDNSDGEWILAFKENGEYMPEDPGYIRLVKVGPQNPNINGHCSARMIKKIVVEGTPFEDFKLTIEQKDLTEVFDRQTMESGVVTNKNSVVYHDRKSNSDTYYMGISLWRLLERPKGYKSVMIEAADGFSVTLDNKDLEGNDDVIIAMYKGDDSTLLDAKEWPLRLVWDKNSNLIPEGIKAIRNVTKITLIY